MKTERRRGYRFTLGQLLLAVALVAIVLGSGVTCRRWRAESFAPDFLAWSPDGSRLAATYLDKTVRVWALPDCCDVATFFVPGHRIIEIGDNCARWAWPLDDDRLLTVGWSGRVRVWRVVTRQWMADFHVKRTPDAVTICPDASLLAFSEDGTRIVGVWNYATRTPVLDVERASSCDSSSLAFLSDGKWLADGRKDGSIEVWDVATGQAVWMNEQQDDSLIPDQEVAFSPDGRRAASTSPSAFQVWDLATHSKQATIPGHGDEIVAMAFSPDGKQLATADRGGNLSLWDPETGTLQATLTKRLLTKWLAFSPDGKTLASASYENVPGWSHGEVALWSMETFEKKAVLWKNGTRLQTTVIVAALVLWTIVWGRAGGSAREKKGGQWGQTLFLFSEGVS